MCAVSGVSSSAFYEDVWTFADAVLGTPDMQMSMPVWDAAWRQRTSAGFQTRSDSPLTNVIGALDGIVARPEHPTATEVTCPKDYWSRKGFFALNGQAICYSNYKFLWMSCKEPGSPSHDSTALVCSKLSQDLSASCIPLVALMVRGGLCITADEAYRDSEFFSVPWPGGEGGANGATPTTFINHLHAYTLRKLLGSLCGAGAFCGSRCECLSPSGPRSFTWRSCYTTCVGGQTQRRSRCWTECQPATEQCTYNRAEGQSDSLACANGALGRSCGGV